MIPYIKCITSVFCPLMVGCITSNRYFILIVWSSLPSVPKLTLASSLEKICFVFSKDILQIGEGFICKLTDQINCKHLNAKPFVEGTIYQSDH